MNFPESARFNSSFNYTIDTKNVTQVEFNANLRGREGAEPRLFAPFNANISANIQNGKNALGSPQNSLTFLLNVIIAVGRSLQISPDRLCESRHWQYF